MSTLPIPWYEEEAGFFGAEYLKQFGSLPSALTHSECDFVVRELHLKPGMAVLDLVCGHGRHAIELARRGFRITGLDNNTAFLEEARRQATEAKVDVSWLLADMRAISVSGHFKTGQLWSLQNRPL
jgi:2-polyprenyl-3-methyl-5-hydroxy-6-metoxy-1,4-benzoquinol methylase